MQSALLGWHRSTPPDGAAAYEHRSLNSKCRIDKSKVCPLGYISDVDAEW